MNSTVMYEEVYNDYALEQRDITISKLQKEKNDLINELRHWKNISDRSSLNSASQFLFNYFENCNDPDILDFWLKEIGLIYDKIQDQMEKGLWHKKQLTD